MASALRTLFESAIDDSTLMVSPDIAIEFVLDAALLTAEGKWGWALDSLVCPTSRLEELGRVVVARGKELPFSIAAVGGVSHDRPAWESALEGDAQVLNRFQTLVGDLAVIDSYEIAAPAPDGLASYIRDLQGFRDADVYLEFPIGADIQEWAYEIAESEWLNAKYGQGEDHAWFVRACDSVDLQFKVAGLSVEKAAKLVAITAIGAESEFSRRELEIAFSGDQGVSFDGPEVRWDEFSLEVEPVDSIRAVFKSIQVSSLADVAAHLDQLATSSG